MVRCKIKGTGKNRQGSPQPSSGKKSKTASSSNKRSTTQSPPTLEVPPVTPIRLMSNSSACSSSAEDDAESVLATPIEPHGPESSGSSCEDVPLVGASYTSFYDDGDFYHDGRTEEEMVFFEGSPFHLLEPEQIGSMMDQDGGAIALPQLQNSAMAMAPALPYASFVRADGGVGGGLLPRMKLQPRSSSMMHHYYTAGTSSGADYMAGCIL